MVTSKGIKCYRTALSTETQFLTMFQAELIQTGKSALAELSFLFLVIYTFSVSDNGEILHCKLQTKLIFATFIVHPSLYVNEPTPGLCSGGFIHER